MLRSAAFDTDSPGYVLQIVNDRLCREIPPKMFVTCLYAVLDPETGRLSFANAGHDLPYGSLGGRSRELRATGMPLGLLPGMRYEEREAVIEEGESVLFYSDGLVEAHNPAREMLGFPRLGDLVRRRPPGHSMIDYLMNELARFTGAGWEQEDDVTVVTLDRSPAPSPPPPLPVASMMAESVRQADEWQRLDRFDLPSAPGNEREAMRRVALAIEPLRLPQGTVERMKTAVAEAVMNAIEHGNLNQPELLTEVEVYASRDKLVVRIADQGLNKTIPPAQTPDLDAKLAGLQSPRGWGLFLIEKMVDRVRAHTDESHHTVELEIDLR
jgi:anti-sigma regulatory factor (Ser/Thr protein kinase)